MDTVYTGKRATLDARTGEKPQLCTQQGAVLGSQESRFLCTHTREMLFLQEQQMATGRKER